MYYIYIDVLYILCIIYICPFIHSKHKDQLVPSLPDWKRMKNLYRSMSKIFRTCRLRMEQRWAPGLRWVTLLVSWWIYLGKL